MDTLSQKIFIGIREQIKIRTLVNSFYVLNRINRSYVIPLPS